MFHYFLREHELPQHAFYRLTPVYRVIFVHINPYLSVQQYAITKQSEQYLSGYSSMIEFRYLLALLIFFMGLYAIYLFITSYFALIALVAAIILFVLAYVIMPNAPQRRDANFDRHDVYWFIEVLISLPFNILVWPFRLLGGFIKHVID